MKALLLSLMLAVPGFAQNTGNAPLTFYQAQFGGVDNYHDSAKIANEDFQDARNVRTYKGYLEKREGSFRVHEGVKPGYPIVFQKEFINSSNNDLFLVQASTQIFSSDFGSAFVEIATVNVNGVTDSVSAFGKHFFTNGYDTPWYTTGTDYVPVYEMPACRLVAFANERLYCANAGGFESTVYTSAFGDYTNWTIPIDLTADAPTSWTMDAQDGKSLTCLYSSPYGVLAWKRNKTFIIKGVDNDDFYKWRISENIGCTDQRSIQLVEGKVTWLGEDGVYQWAGGNSTPELISRPIDTTIKQIRQNTANANKRAIATPDEFAAGLFSANAPSVAWSTAIVSGAIVPSTWTGVDAGTASWAAGTLGAGTTFYNSDGALGLMSGPKTLLDAFSDGDYTSNPAWTTSGACTTVSVFDQELRAYSYGAVDDTCYLALSTATPAYGEWSYFVSARHGTEWWYYLVASESSVASSNGYALKTTNAGAGAPDLYEVALYKTSGDTHSLLGSASLPACTIRSGTVSVVRDTTGKFTVTYTEVLGTSCADYGTSISLFSVTDNTYTSSDYKIIKVRAKAPGYPAYLDSVTDNYYVPGAVPSSGTFTSRIFDTGFTLPVGGVFGYTATIPTDSTVTFSLRDSADTITWSAWTPVVSYSSASTRIPLTQRYWQYTALFTVTYASATPKVYSVDLHAVSTGTWDSAVLFVGNSITSWGQFNAVDTVTPDSALSYYVRTSSASFTKDASLPTWVAQVNGINVSTTIGAYAQVRVLSNVGSSTDTAQVNSITLNWNEGDAAAVASVYFDKNYYLAVNTSSSSTSNETILVLQRDGKWQIDEGLTYGTLGLYARAPYAGSGFTDSKIWRIMYTGAFYDDNNLPINAYAITKDFQFDGQNNNKLLRQLYLESFPTTGGVLDLAYSVDKSTTYYTTSQSLTANVMYNDEVKKMFPGYAKGRYVKFKFSNNVVDEYFKVDAYTVLGEFERLYRR